MSYKVGDVFLQITTNAAKAAEDLRQFTNELAKEVGMYEEATKAAQKNIEATRKEISAQTRQQKEALKAALEKIAQLEEEERVASRLGKLKEAEHKESMKRYRKAADRARIFIIDQMRHEAEFTDYAGTQAEQRARRGEKVRKSELKDLEGFLSRATMQHNRYADTLDRRDMTGSLIENIRRGVQKGLLISERWHKDDNALQKIARGFGIAGSAFDKVRSYSERAADAFYKLQRVGYLVQTAVSALAGSLGALMGGLMGLVGVIGVASGSLVALGSSMMSVVSGFIAARIGFGKIGNAVGQAWQQQRGYNNALYDARKQLRALKFDAEEAALSEQEAALNLEKAREDLARVQDLPPDSRVRREVELQYQQAELAYRRAKDRNRQAREDLKRNTNNPNLLMGAAGQDPFAGLTASQRKFAKYLVGLRPIFTQFRESVASSFLGPLQNAFKTIISKVFPTLQTGMSKVAGAMGRAAEFFADALADPKNLELLSSFFTASVPVIEKFGKIAGSAFGGILAVLKAAEPLTDRFTTWVQTSADNFEKWAKGGLEDGSLEKFFNLAGDVAASLGGVFRNIFDGIRAIMDAAFPGGDVNAGAGGVLLQWLTKISEGFLAFTSNSSFGAWLEQTTTTATTALSTIGDFLGIMLDIADEPALQTFWETLRQAVDPVRSIFRDGAQAAPAFASLLVSVARVFQVLSESGALTTFMETLAAIFDSFASGLTAIEPLLTVIGRFHAWILALTAVFFLLRKAGMVFFGIFEKMFSTIGGFSKQIFTASAGVMRMRDNFQMLQKSTLVNTIGMGKMQAASAKAQATLGNLGTSIWQVVRASSTRKNQEFLLAMAKAAGAADAEVQALSLHLAKAAQAGNTTTESLRRAAIASAQAAKDEKALAAAKQAGIMNGAPKAGARLATGLAGASSAVGVTQMVASQMGLSMQGPASQIAGAIGMFGSMIPGIPGLIIGALGGLGSIVIGAIEGARLEAKAKIDNIKEIAANNINTQQIVTQKKADMAREFIAAGLSPEKAGKAVASVSAVAAAKAKTPEALAAGLGASGIKAIITSLMTQGGAETTKILSDPTSKAARKLIDSAVNVAMSTRGPSSKGITADEAATAASTALASGKKIGVFRNQGGKITTGAGAFTADEMRAGAQKQQSTAERAQGLGSAYFAAMDKYLSAKRAATASVDSNGLPITVAGRKTAEATLQNVTAALDKAREAYMKSPTMQGKGIVLDNKDPLKTELVGTKGISFSSTGNTVKLDNAKDYMTMIKSLGTIAENTGKTPPAPVVKVVVDEKVLKDAGWKKKGG